jgi:UDP-N-acetylglucosamine 2-epimerase (non-hydrolysing)
MAMKIVLVAGARPNFMKLAPLFWTMNQFPSVFQPTILHTGQHYDYEMSKAFFEDLDLPEPHYFLGVGSGSHAEQTGRIMIEFERAIGNEHPNLLVVFGDVNSTLACSVTAKKLYIPVAHVEAGLRSYDMTMPEEINRKVTDAISDILFTPSRDGNENLIHEGVERNKIHLVGNIMIDSLVTILERINPSDEDKVFQKFGLKRNHFALVTLHRPSNVDDKKNLEKIMSFLNHLSLRIPVIFPVHPRTKKNINGLSTDYTAKGNFRIVEPLRYKEFITLEKNPKFVVTDSGGIQEETTYLNIPCLTLRPNTERPVTITEGTNELVTYENIEQKIDLILSGNWKKGKLPELWDGMTGQRIVNTLERMEF